MHDVITRNIWWWCTLSSSRWICHCHLKLTLITHIKVRDIITQIYGAKQYSFSTTCAHSSLMLRNTCIMMCGSMSLSMEDDCRFQMWKCQHSKKCVILNGMYFYKYLYKFSSTAGYWNTNYRCTGARQVHGECVISVDKVQECIISQSTWCQMTQVWRWCRKLTCWLFMWKSLWTNLVPSPTIHEVLPSSASAVCCFFRKLTYWLKVSCKSMSARQIAIQMRSDE